MQSYYRAMPEEFYMLSGLKVVTPLNAREWCDVVRGQFKTLDLSETMSGSGRLTLTAYTCGLLVSFPRDIPLWLGLDNC